MDDDVDLFLQRPWMDSIAARFLAIGVPLPTLFRPIFFISFTLLALSQSVLSRHERSDDLILHGLL